jgi:lysophospholipid hydrolase
MDILEKFEEEGRLPSNFIDGKEGQTARKKKGRSARRNSV